MAKFIRYTLAAVCFAASICWMALWWRSQSFHDVIVVNNGFTAKVGLETYLGTFRIVLLGSNLPPVSWAHNAESIDNRSRQILVAAIERHGRFQGSSSQVRFPLWYPALVFVLAGVGVLRFRRKFSIRSALICVSVVALLLGMAVAL